MNGVWCFVIWIAALFVLWKVYLFITWNIERAIFFGGIQGYVSDKKKPARKKAKKAAQ